MEALAQMMAGMMGFNPNLAMRSCGINFDRFGQQRSKQQIMQEHAEGLKHTNQLLASPHSVVTTTSNNRDIKPPSEFPTPPNIAECTPISVADLQPGTTHRGRVLRGKLVVKANYTGSVHSVLEDAAGDYVQVFIYNHPGVEADSRYSRKVAEAQRVFACDAAVAILEPFFKLMSDGSFGVRVDNPDEVVFVDNICPSDVSGWQDEGRRCFQAKQYKHAAAAYDRALELMQQTLATSPSSSSSSRNMATSATLGDGALLLQLLLNTAAAHHKLQQPLPSMAYALAAVAFSNHKSSKAFYRLALAADALAALEGQPEASSSAKAVSSPLAASAAALMMKSLELMPDASSTAQREQYMAQMTTWTPHNNSSTSTAAGTTAKSKKQRSPSKPLGSNVDDTSIAWMPIFGVMGGSMNQTLDGGCSQRTPLVEAAAGRAAADELAGLSSPGQSAATICTGTNGSSNSRGHAAASTKGHSAAELKELANQSFRSGDYQAALGQYEAALRHDNLQHTLSQAAVLLSNRSACWLQLGGQQLLQQAAVDASAAALLDQNQVKPFYRAASAVLQMGLMSAVAEICQRGLQLHPADGSLQQLQTRITVSASSRKANSPSSNLNSGTATSQQASACKDFSSSPVDTDSSRENPLSEREYAQLNASQHYDVEQLSMMNTLATMAARFGKPAAGKQHMQMIDDRIPSFHEEFAKGGRWPPQVDTARAQRMLWDGYETARSLPMHMLALTSSDHIDAQVLLQRLGATPAADKARTRWLVEAPPGDVRFHPRRLYDGGRMFQSFSNVAAHTEALTPGTTHVAIGFVDLGSLAAACKVLKLQQAAATVTNKQHLLKPLRWVGYEMSAYAVAKALVLLEMINLDAMVDVILQAWFSSAWSHATLSAFRSALSTILQRQQQQLDNPQHLLPAAVSDLLHHWQTNDVTLSAALSAWLAGRNHSCTYIANFKRKSDRLALAKYHVTGQLLDADVGNVMMFAVPHSYGERALDESFLQALPYFDLMGRMRGGGARGPDIVEVGQAMLRERITDLKELITSGAVAAELRLATVAPSATPTLASIKALNPYTISWSNVPDYIQPAAFHRMARAVSSEEDTVHFMHSMNWVKDVKGAFHVDMMLMMPDERLPEAMPEFLRGSCQGINALYTAKRLDKLLLSPPVDNPRNIMDYSLFHVHHKEWVSAFFASKVSGIRHFERQVQVVQPPEYAVLSRTNSTMHITFTYDEDIKFNVLLQ